MEKLTKLGITSLSVMALGAVAPLVAPDVFGANVVYAEEQRARTLSVSDASYDANGIYLPTVDLGMTQLVNVTPDTPYTVNQPEIDGWDNYVISYSKGDSSFHKEMKNGDQITYDDLFEDDEGTYGGVLIYSYKQPQPASDQPTTPVKPEKPAENIENNRKINFNYYEYGSVNQPEGINGPSTVTVAPGETYSLPNIEVPNHYLYRIDSNLTGVKDVKPGHKINYDSLPDTYDGADVYYIYKQGTKPETPADKPTVIHIGDQPTSPVNETSLYYTIERRFGDPNDGVGWVVEEKPNINAGETHEVEGLSDISKPWTIYRIMEGTPESYTISYDDVKSGKTRYVFRLYNTKTHNSDGTPKTEVPTTKPETPANKPAEELEKPVDKPVEPAKPEVPTDKPSDKPAEKPTTPEKPTEKPATKPTDTNKPVVKPADNSKPEVKPENKVEPKAEVKPEKQAGNAAANAQTPAPKAESKAPAAAAPKADKPADKKMETLPNTGESQSSLALLGLALGVLGLQGLTYKGRHDRKR